MQGTKSRVNLRETFDKIYIIRRLLTFTPLRLLPFQKKMSKNNLPHFFIFRFWQRPLTWASRPSMKWSVCDAANYEIGKRCYLVHLLCASWQLVVNYSDDLCINHLSAVHKKISCYILSDINFISVNSILIMIFFAYPFSVFRRSRVPHVVLRF